MTRVRESAPLFVMRFNNEAIVRSIRPLQIRRTAHTKLPIQINVFSLTYNTLNASSKRLKLYKYYNN